MGFLETVFSRSPDLIRRKWRQGLTEIGKRRNFGTRPYDRNWEVLIVLDACRWDLWERYAPKHHVNDRIRHVESIYSCASSSDEWLLKSFQQAPDEIVGDSIYVTANAYTHKIDIDRFYDVEEVWRYGRDPRSGTVFPEVVTNEAIRAYRDAPDKRLIIHYLQPHAPFLHCLDKYHQSADNQEVWRGIQQGEFERDDVFKDYGQNLLTVLDHVETILDNVTGTIAITSDHGNFVGEWGLYGHPSWVPLPAVKRVPWAVAEGNNQESYKIRDRDSITTVETEEPSVKEHLRQLGYVE